MTSNAMRLDVVIAGIKKWLWHPVRLAAETEKRIELLARDLRACLSMAHGCQKVMKDLAMDD